MRNTIHVHLLYNPKAGDERRREHRLLEVIESHGFTCQHASMKAKGWKRFKDKTGLVVVAGGDGTVREVMKRLMNRRILDKPLTVALVPSGTANNFAKTMGISPELTDFERCLAAWNTKKVDVGAVRNLRGSQFFIEGLGVGLIPRLIGRMDDVDLTGIDTPEQELAVALAKLLEIALTYRAKAAKIWVDDRLYEGNYLLIEVLNIRSVGPNVILAPRADPTDGVLEVVMVREEDRDAFVYYLQRLQRGGGAAARIPWKVVKATQSITMRCEHKLVHVDDELVKQKKGKKIDIVIRTGVVDLIT